MTYFLWHKCYNISLKLTFKNETITLNPGDALFIPMGEASSMENPGSETTELLAVIAPSKNSEELEL